jgi:UDP-galactopyranose mutase
MAAEKPIVSTPIADVVEQYGHIVYLGDTPASFVAACERALGAPDADRAARTAGMRTVLARTSWGATVQAMEDLIDALPPPRRVQGGTPTWASDRSSSSAPGRRG